MSEKIDGKTAQGQGLLPCPFCGESYAMHSTDTTEYGVILHSVSCQECDAYTKEFAEWKGATREQTKAESIAAWNRRTPTAQSEPARDVEEAASRDPVAEVGEFGGVTFFKALDPNTLLFTRPWLDSEIEMARMQAAEMVAHFKEAPSAQQQPESGS